MIVRRGGGLGLDTPNFKILKYFFLSFELVKEKFSLVCPLEKCFCHHL